MTIETQGKLILRAIPDENVKQRVIAFICAHSQNAAPEAFAARLKKLPFVLSSTISAHAADRAVRSLVEMGADAVFIPNQPPPDFPWKFQRGQIDVMIQLATCHGYFKTSPTIT